LIADLAEGVEAGEIAAKTVNNALVTLVVCLNDAVEDGLLVANPALRVQRLPPAHIEREYLRVGEGCECLHGSVLEAHQLWAVISR